MGGGGTLELLGGSLGGGLAGTASEEGLDKEEEEEEALQFRELVDGLRLSGEATPFSRKRGEGGGVVPGPGDASPPPPPVSFS